MDIMKELHEMCETLNRAIKEANEKIRTAGGKVSPGDMDFINKLTHSLKSVKATIAMLEDEEEDDGYSERYSRNYSGRRYSREGRSYDDGSYARGRGSYAKRDSMGRYSSRYSRNDGYSNHGDMVDDLRDLMNDAPDDATRQEMQRLIQKLEQR